MNKTKYLLAIVSFAAIASSAMAFPTKVKIMKEPDLASYEGTKVGIVTNRGSLLISYKDPAYNVMSRAKTGQCFILETDTEDTVNFNKKVDESGVSTIKKSRC